METSGFLSLSATRSLFSRSSNFVKGRTAGGPTEPPTHTHTLDAVKSRTRVGVKSYVIDIVLTYVESFTSHDSYFGFVTLLLYWKSSNFLERYLSLDIYQKSQFFQKLFPPKLWELCLMNQCCKFQAAIINYHVAVWIIPVNWRHFLTRFAGQFLSDRAMSIASTNQLAPREHLFVCITALVKAKCKFMFIFMHVRFMFASYGRIIWLMTLTWRAWVTPNLAMTCGRYSQLWASSFTFASLCVLKISWEE